MRRRILACFLIICLLCSLPTTTLAVDGAEDLGGAEYFDQISADDGEETDENDGTEPGDVAVTNPADGEETEETDTTGPTEGGQEPGEMADGEIVGEGVGQPPAANADDFADGSLPDVGSMVNTVVAFASLEEAVAQQSVALGTAAEELNLPAEVAAYGEVTDNEAFYVPVTWKAEPEFNGDVSGVYTFTAVLPDDYVAAEGVTLPAITVIVREAVMLALADDTVAVIEKEDGSVAQYTSLKAAVDAAPVQTPTTIQIVADMVEGSQVDIYAGKNIILTSEEPYTITFNITDGTASRCFNIWSGALTIDGLIMVTTENSALRALVNVGGSGSNFCLRAGTLYSANANLSRGIVCVDVEGCFTMVGGEIRGNQSCESRGVYLQDWEDNGGTVPVTFTMEGGVITDCMTAENGGGIFVSSDKSVIINMSGGSIVNCSASSGGAVSMAYGSFTMTGGRIENCSGSNRGGGVYLSGS